MNCRVCGSEMEPGPVGPDEQSQWSCLNLSCIAHHRRRKCPGCGQPIVSVVTSRSGERTLTCKQGHDWPFGNRQELTLELAPLMPDRKYESR